MADYADSYTKRLRVHYKAAGFSHTIQVRGDRSASIGTFLSEADLLVGTVFTAVAATLADDFEFISSEYAMEDSVVYIPIPPPSPVTGLKAVGLFLPINKITSTTFSGKTVTGSKARVSLFGVWWSLGTAGDAEDFVVTAGEDAGVEAVWEALGGMSTLTAIDSNVPYWYARATIKPNDAWIRKVRAGA